MTLTACALWQYGLWWHVERDDSHLLPSSESACRIWRLYHLCTWQTLYLRTLISKLTHDKNHRFRDGRGPASIFSLFCSCCPEFVVGVRAPPMIACLYREVTSPWPRSRHLCLQTDWSSQAVEAMRKSLSTSLSDSLSTARVFGIPLEEVQHSGQPGHEVPLLVRSIVEYIEEHGEWGGTLMICYFLSILYLFVFSFHQWQHYSHRPSRDKIEDGPESTCLPMKSWF